MPARTDLRRGDLFWLDWSPGRGSEQEGRRPALVVQRDAANRNENYPNTIVVAISTQGRPIPFHIELAVDPENGLSALSYAKCEQLFTVNKDRLQQRIGRVGAADLDRVGAALRLVLALDEAGMR